ncbi:malonate decarboxylase acyl carrier protein [Yersinia pseudotuberculosis]|uniref:Malonate decarboxylase acyl carrier protein n=1 Tax=Yersinia pseudotuberculosis TaxID=633 RepID=A0A0T9JJL3_YERPU|nr:malonate decarboxylase acyl carrier protein [Yersinia pseudotuberculosis]PSH22644.1 malonate decarboxylase acyl carrier protein [Yersinia pseudotuberculosis]CNC80484.1 Malonate decarboxylase subunit delta [Yersinia pseudotuberculosis]SUP80026.1 Malonate decarboxylase subunit delta [Yersinia pseudotuberculosis]
MALNQLNFTFQVASPRPLPASSAHFGVVGSGDIEVLLESADLSGAVEVSVTTPVNGFEHVWQLVLKRFIDSSQLGDVAISINDNNATPAVVALRLEQALAEITQGDSDA